MGVVCSKGCFNEKEAQGNGVYRPAAVKDSKEAQENGLHQPAPVEDSEEARGNGVHRPAPVEDSKETQENGVHQPAPVEDSKEPRGNGVHRPAPVEDSREAVILSYHLPKLCENLEATAVMIHLISKNIISRDEADQIRAQDTPSEKNYLLVEFVRKRGPEAFQSFVESLRATKQQHLADQLHNHVHQKNCTPEHVFGKLQTVLKKLYLDRFRQTNPFSLPFSFDIEKTWVSLALSDNRSKLNETEDHAELLNKAFSEAKMLIIEGPPATGKTSLMRRLVYDWARGSQEMAHYDIVFYAEFRDVCERPCKDIAKLVRRCLRPSLDKGKNKLKMFTKNKKYWQRYRVLVLLDGYDESSGENQCEELINYLSKKNKDGELPFYIVLTTRQGFLSLYRGQGRSVFANVLGFKTKEQKEKYILNHFSSKTDNSESIQAVNALLQLNPNLNELSETPLFLTFICILYENITAGTWTLVELYCSIIWWILDRHQQDFPTRDVSNLFGFPHSLKPGIPKFQIIQNNYLRFSQLSCLSTMALQNLEKKTFLQEDLNEFGLQSIVEQVGLLRKDEHMKGLSRTTVFAFPHQTIQEFLAAYAFFSHSEILADKIANKIFHDDTKTEMNEFEKFLWRIAMSSKMSIDSVMFFKRFTNLVIDFDVLMSTLGMSLTQIASSLAMSCNVTTLVFYTQSCHVFLSETIDLSEMTKMENFHFRNFEFKFLRRISQRRLPKTSCAQRDACFILLPKKPICVHLELIEFEYSKQFVLLVEHLSQVLGEDSQWKLTNVTVGSEIEKRSYFNVNTKKEILSKFARFKTFANPDLRKTSKIFADQGLNEALQKLSCAELCLKSPTTVHSVSFEHFSELCILSFSDFVFPKDAKLMFKNSTFLETLIFKQCVFDSMALQSITEEIANSSVRKLQFSIDFFRKELVGLLEFLQNCYLVQELKIDCDNEDLFFWDLFEEEFSKMLSTLATKMQQLNRIILLGRTLQDHNKKTIRKAGQIKGKDFIDFIVEEEIL